MSLLAKTRESLKVDFMIAEDFLDVLPRPVPASGFIPKWWSNLPLEHYTDESRLPVRTAKVCVPLLESFSTGYMFLLPTDVHVTAEGDGKAVQFDTKSEDDFGVISGHSRHQMPLVNTGQNVFKWGNPWVMKTPPGWSTLFIHPVRDHALHPLPFRQFAGLADTDVYNTPVLFPFIWYQFPFRGWIDKGTPIVQAIPVRRTDDWDSPVYRAMSDDRGQGREKRIQKHHIWPRLL